MLVSYDRRIGAKSLLWMVACVITFNSCLSTRYNYNSLHPKWMETELSLERPDFSETVLEFRVWEKNYSVGETVLSVFQKQENTEWNGRRISYVSYNKGDFSKTDWSSINIDKSMSAFLDALSWDTFSDVPLQSDIDEMMSHCSDQVLLVADGNSFVFDFLSKRNKKRIEVNNPEAFFEFYDKSGCKNLPYAPLQRLLESWQSSSAQ